MKRLLTIAALLFGMTSFAQDGDVDMSASDGPTIDRLFAHYPGDSLLIKNQKGEFMIYFHRDYNNEGQPLSMTASMRTNQYPALAELVYELIVMRKADGFVEVVEKPYSEAVLHREISDGWIIDITLQRGEEFYTIKGQRNWEYKSDLMQEYELKINFIDRDRRSGVELGEFKF